MKNETDIQFCMEVDLIKNYVFFWLVVSFLALLPGQVNLYLKNTHMSEFCSSGGRIEPASWAIFLKWQDV